MNDSVPHDPPNKKPAPRATGCQEIEEKMRDQLIDVVNTHCPGVQLLSPASINRGHPAFVAGGSEGLFLITIEKVSNATVEPV